MIQSDAIPRGGDLRRGLFGAFTLSTASILLNAVSIPAMAYIIRKLGAVDYGQWTIAISIVNTFSTLTNLGLRRTFIRSIARDPGRVHDLLPEQLGVRLALGILSAFAALALCVALKYSFIVILCTFIAGVGLVLGSLYTTFSDLLESLRQLPKIASSNMAAGLLLTGASVLVLWCGGGPLALSISYLVGPIVSLIFLANVTGRARSSFTVRFNVRRSAYLIWDGRHIALQQFVCALSSSVVFLCLPKIIGVGRFGLFSAGALLITRLAVVPDAIGTAFFPLFANSYAHDRKSLRRHLLWGISAAVVVGLCIAAGCAIVAGPIAHILFPKSPAECQRVIQCTIWALPLMGIQAVVGYSLTAAHRDAAQAKSVFISGVIAVVLGAACTLKWGTQGACFYLILRPVLQFGAAAPDFFRTFYRCSAPGSPVAAAAAQPGYVDRQPITSPSPPIPAKDGASDDLRRGGAAVGLI